MSVWAFIRHGQTDWNLQNRLQGQVDIPLNTTGVQQLHETAAGLVGQQWQRVVSSPLSRARHSAEIIAAKLMLPEPDVVPGLLEKDYGEAEGRSLEGLTQAEKLQLIGNVGEADAAVAARGIASLQELYQQHGKENLLLVSHGSFIRLTLNALAGMQIKRVANGEVVRFDPHLLNELS